MRCRRLAASVWATETDSTKPIRLMRRAGTASVLTSSKSMAGRPERQAERDDPNERDALAAQIEHCSDSDCRANHQDRTGLGDNAGRPRPNPSRNQ